MGDDVEWRLPWTGQVVDRRSTLEDVQLRTRVEGVEVRALQVAANKSEPVARPEKQGPEARAGSRRITHAGPAHGSPAAHRPVSSRNANRSGSSVSLITRWA